MLSAPVAALPRILTTYLQPLIINLSYTHVSKYSYSFGCLLFIPPSSRVHQFPFWEFLFPSSVTPWWGHKSTHLSLRRWKGLCPSFPCPSIAGEWSWDPTWPIKPSLAGHGLRILRSDENMQWHVDFRVPAAASVSAFLLHRALWFLSFPVSGSAGSGGASRFPQPSSTFPELLLLVVTQTLDWSLTHQGPNE